VAGIAGDQQAALFGQACHRPGDAKNTYGTGSFVLLNSGEQAPDPVEGLLGTIAWGLGGETTYALEAAVFVTGSAVQWLRDGLGLIVSAAETAALAASLEDNDDVYFVPALTGLGSPYWDPYARGTLIGLTRGTGRAQIARATLEAIAYQTVDAVRAQETASGERLSALRADGGAVVNEWLMQFQADVLGSPVIVPEISETTALGAAYLAGIAVGIWDRETVAGMWRQRVAYEPRMSDDRRETLISRWHEAVSRSRGWTRPTA
jgi:glycerol kinase